MLFSSWKGESTNLEEEQDVHQWELPKKVTSSPKRCRLDCIQIDSLKFFPFHYKHLVRVAKCSLEQITVEKEDYRALFAQPVLVFAIDDERLTCKYHWKKRSSQLHIHLGPDT